MHLMTKACKIPYTVKVAVLARDNCKCIWCDSARGEPVAHFIPRSAGGLGIEENILTLCPECHRKYDESSMRTAMRRYFESYLKERYPEWNEKNLIYRKGENHEQIIYHR